MRGGARTVYVFAKLGFLGFDFTGPNVSWAGVLLATGLGIYLLLVALGRLLKRRFGTRLGIIYQLFCAALGPYLAIVLLHTGVSVRRDLGALSSILGAGVLVRLMDQYFWRWYFEEKRKVPIPKFIREVTAILIFLVVVLLLLEFSYDVHVPGLLTASGVVGIILGFALQDSLGNIIAGFALQFGRPFHVGDWLQMDNQHVQAVEINWRSTRFITNDAVQLDVPNQQIVKQTIVNYHGGGVLHAMRLEIGIDYDATPNRVKDVLARAAATAHGVLSEPAPVVFLKNFGDSAIIYEVRFWLDDHRLYNGIADAIRTNIWYALRRHHIRTPYPIRHVQIERPKPTTRPGVTPHEKRHDATRELLTAQPLFEGMGDEHLKTLIDHSPIQHYGRGETIIREGADGASMFVLVNGEAGVSVMMGTQPTRVATLNGGDCFGEMSLLTGEKRSASVLAASDCEVMEITKKVFGDIIARDAGLLQRLSELLASRQLENEGIVQARVQQNSSIIAKAQEYQAGFLHKLRSFFEL